MRIGVVAPGRGIERDLAARVSAFAALTFPQLDLVFHEQCFAGDGHFAGSDALRAAAFLEVANDPGYDGMWFARGGYGSNRILDTVIPQLGNAAAAKRYCGYSDIGFLFGAMYARRIGRLAHGPMAIDFGAAGAGAAAVARALGWFAGDDGGLEPGLGTAPAAAFNLAILTALIGTPWLPDLTDHILLIEDVGEPLYRIDRMLFTLSHATQLKGIAGVRLGQISDIQPNDPPWQGDLDAMIVRWCAEMKVPYLGRARIGHGRDNHVVPFGIA
ncbi:MAG: LD-carboxypeptidase [Pseudomonadota bacterium]